MSFMCNDCRIKRKLEHTIGWPFGTSRGPCEDCGKVAECENLKDSHAREEISLQIGEKSGVFP